MRKKWEKLQPPAKSREIQDYHSAVTVKSSGDISADLVRQGIKTTARGQNPAREAVSSGPRRHFVKNEKII